jgi:hypothetical protein
VEITIGDRTYELNQLRLKKWVEFESLKEKILDQAKHGNVESFSKALLSCVSFCVNIDEEEIKDVPWIEIASAYRGCQEVNSPSISFPIFFAQIKKRKLIGWDYEERSWYVWVHTLARVFGWSSEYIAELVIDDAIGLIEEIYVQDQLDKEWEWSLSEVAYSNKDGRFKPLPRPPWMESSSKYISEEEAKIKMPKAMMPVGKIIHARWLKDDAKH